MLELQKEGACVAPPDNLIGVDVRMYSLDISQLLQPGVDKLSVSSHCQQVCMFISQI